MRNFREASAVAAVAAVLLSGCSQAPVIEGTIKDAPGSEIVVNKLDINRLTPLDTLVTDASGKFSYKVKDVRKGDPEFIYLTRGGRTLAALVVKPSDRIRVEADTVSLAEVTGPEDAVRMQEIEKDFETFLSSIAVAAASENPSAAASRVYVDYYRDRVKYVMTNKGSITVIPVLFQQAGDDLPVFGQTTDALHFTAAADTLEKVWPDSRYVKALRKEADRRQKMMDISLKIREAPVRGFPEIELLDMKGQKVLLSEVDAPLVMLYFWSSSDPAQKMFNLDDMRPLYEDFHPKGLEIFAVSLDEDKTRWASTVRAQKLPWINVCDTRGSESPLISLYSIAGLPVAMFIKDGELQAGTNISDNASMRAFIASKLGK